MYGTIARSDGARFCNQRMNVGETPGGRQAVVWIATVVVIACNVTTTHYHYCTISTFASIRMIVFWR